jgi:CRISPR/Cas system-associated exonuclease Cas4 (RecB family)
MMQIVYFSQKEQFLTEMESREGEKVYVAPSPAKADGLRNRISLQGSQDVITIAKFTANLVEALWKGEDRPLVKKKAELLLIFGILKNKYLPELGYEQFNQAYNLFSDLRSFTLDQDALSSVLDEQPEIIKNAVLLFWKLLEVTGFHDEHGAYREISERLRSSEDLPELRKTYIFWGFQHLNGQQVDLLKALAIRYDVIIPFPFTLKEKLKKSDWVSWLKDAKTTEANLPVKHQVPKASWLTINSREISLHLKDILRDGDQVILGVSKLGPLYLDLLPSQKVMFKIPHQILSNELAEISDELKGFRGNHLELYEACSERMKKAKGLKLYRAWQLYGEALKSISDQTDDLLQVDTFLLKVLLEVVALNSPRTSYVPVASESLTIDLKDISTLEDIDRSRRVILCVDERFEDIQGLGQNYTESIQKALAALGPLKRNELELLFKQWEFRDLFSRAEVLVLMNEATIKHSLIWKRLFTDIDFIRAEKTSQVKERKLKDHFRSLEKKSFESTFSASKLQAFMDCPRKFYFNYVDRVFPNILLEKDFDQMTAGTIIHEIIEKFFKENHSDEKLKDLTKEIMQMYIREKNLHLPREVYLERELIFNHRAWNGIKFIREMEKIAGEKINWKIEEPFHLTDGFTLKGRIDCMGVGKKYLFLLDFKSTEFSASSSAEVTDYEAIQLWAYAHASTTLVSDFDSKMIILGYVVLDDASKSNLLTDDEELASRIKESKLCKIHKFKDDFSLKLIEAKEKMTSLTFAIASEKDFPARPRKSHSCTFCDLNKVCVKSELPDV